MSDIEWTDKTWNPMVGCSRVAKSNGLSGCDNCYAEGQVNRFAERYDRPTTIKLGASKRPGLTFVPKGPDGRTLGKGARWTGAVWLLPDVLEVPLRRRKPTAYFVNSQSDVFHESVVGCEEGRRFIAAMFGVMAATPQHTYQILTKRPAKAREWLAWFDKMAFRAHCSVFQDDSLNWCRGHVARAAIGKTGSTINLGSLALSESWPLPNVWIGTSVEDQESADQRIPLLLELPAAVRFLSCEPLLGPVDLDDEHPWLTPLYRASFAYLAKRSPGDPPVGKPDPSIDWVIVGGESGPKARRCEVGWIRSIVEQCKTAGVPVFVKQLGARSVARDEFDLGPEAHLDYDAEHAGEPFPRAHIQKLRNAKGGDPSEWPEELRVREMPEVQP